MLEYLSQKIDWEKVNEEIQECGMRIDKMKEVLEKYLKLFVTNMENSEKGVYEALVVNTKLSINPE